MKRTEACGAKSPFVRISQRNDISPKQRLIIRAASVAVAILVDALFILIVSGKNPFLAFGKIFEGTFGNKIKFTETVKETFLLLGVAIALFPAYKMKFWNVGGQGQILMGALAAAAIMKKFPDVPNFLLILIMLLAAIVAGAAWGMIPAVFKSFWYTNETLFTLIMNYVAIQFVVLYVEKNRGLTSSSLGIINGIDKSGWLPVLGNATVLPAILISVILVAMYFYIVRSKQGYEVTVVGESLNTARYAGINVKAVIIRTMAISGAVCGFIGFLYVSGLNHTISDSTSGSYGFTAVIVCWLANLNPFLMILYSLIIVFFQKGGLSLQSSKISPALNSYSSEIIIAVFLFSLLISNFFIKYRVQFRKKEKETESVEGK